MLEKSPKSIFFSFKNRDYKIDKGTRIYRLNCTVIFGKKKVTSSNKRLHDHKRISQQKRVISKRIYTNSYWAKTVFDKVFWKF